MPTTDDKSFYDFDAWYDEHVDKTIPFRVLGETWDIPGDVPAVVLLRLQRLERVILTGRIPDGFEDELEELSYESMVRAMVGDTIVDAWIAKGIPHKMLQAVSRRLYAIYKGEDPDVAMGLGKAPAVKTPQDRRPRKKAPARKTPARVTTSSAGS